MSNRTDLELHPSHAVGLLCALPWLALALFVAAAASEFGYVLLILLVPALAGATHQYRRTGLLFGPNAVIGLRVENRRLHACLRSGQELAVEAGGESRLGARFAILKLQPSGTIFRTHPVVLMAMPPWFCNTSPDAFRRLRVWLRLGPSSGGKASGDQAQETH